MDGCISEWYQWSGSACLGIIIISCNAKTIYSQSLKAKQDRSNLEKPIGGNTRSWWIIHVQNASWTVEERIHSVRCSPITIEKTATGSYHVTTDYNSTAVKTLYLWSSIMFSHESPFVGRDIVWRIIIEYSGFKGFCLVWSYH